jgi:surfeit locus 1 family protein
MNAKLSRGRFWVVTLAALLMIALTFSLGQWQLGRAAQKQALQASLDQTKLLPALGNADLLGVDGSAGLNALKHRRVQLSGVWQPGKTVYLDNRPMHGRPGFWVLTPLLLEGSDKSVLVQRGWIARDFVDRTRLAAIQTPSQTITLQGRMAPAPAKLYAFEGADFGTIRQNLDIGLYSEETRLPLIAALVLQTDPDSDGLQRDWAAPGTGVDKHYGYAAQWFGLCALVLGLYVWFQLILPRRRRPSGTEQA